MTALDWASVDRLYIAGVDHGVLYVPDVPGIAWDGLVSVEEKSEVDTRTQYVDGVALSVLQTAEDFTVTLSAYTYPEAFERYTGYDDNFIGPSQRFGLSYRIGDAETGQIHLLYDACAVPSDAEWKTLTTTSEITLFKWDISGLPFEYPGICPSAHVIIDISSANPGFITELSGVLYGTSITAPRLPDLFEMIEIYDNYATLKVIDNGDGTWTATGPSSYITYTDATTFSINTPSASFLTSTSYLLSSDY